MDEKIKIFCNKWQINKMSFFGSVNTEKFNTESDIDILLSFNDNVSVGFFELSDIKVELEHMFDRKVDIITDRGLSGSSNHIRKKSIQENTKVVFTAE